MIKSTKRHVITGTSCSGKTTTCQELLGLGYIVMPEMARKLIRAEQAKENGDLPWNRPGAFQRELFRRQCDLEEQTSQTPEVIMDRSLIDIFAYSRVYGVSDQLEGPTNLQSIDCRNRYCIIFLLEPLPFKQDSERRETPELAQKIHNEITRAYSEFGYAPVRVPVMKPGERAQFIDKVIQQIG